MRVVGDTGYTTLYSSIGDLFQIQTHLQYYWRHFDVITYFLFPSEWPLQSQRNFSSTWVLLPVLNTSDLPIFPLPQIILTSLLTPGESTYLSRVSIDWPVMSPDSSRTTSWLIPFLCNQRCPTMYQGNMLLNRVYNHSSFHGYIDGQ